jgi:hypothetical protein
MIFVQYIWLDGVLRLACTEKTSFFFFWCFELSNESNIGNGDDFCGCKTPINFESFVVILCLMQAVIYYDLQ